MGLRCLVTGGSGFIGLNLLETLVNSEHVDRVVSLDRLPCPWSDPKLETRQLDGGRLPELIEAVTGVDRVFHLAADSDVDKIQADPSTAVRNNVGFTGELLEACRQQGVGRFLFASSTWVYMDCQDEVLTEDTPVAPPIPSNLYAATKLAGEILCHSYHQHFGLPTTVLRFATPYGRYMRPELVVLKFIRQAMRGEPITIAGGGHQTRNFVYVGDLADGLLLAALEPRAAGRTYNLSGARPVSIRELAETVRRVVPNAPPVQYVGSREADFSGRFELCDRARQELGWEPATEIEAGVQHLYDWVAELDARSA